jgi:DNA repair exonuclease SbcCD ATPase subunit
MAHGDFVDTDLLEDEAKPASSFESRTPNLRAKFTSKEEEARKRLDEIRQQMEDLERQRLENAELTRRLEEFERTKVEATHQLIRTIATLEKHELEISKQLGSVTSVRKSLQEHLGNLEDIHEESWTGDNVRQNLQDSIESLEEARNDLSQGRQQLAFLENIDMAPPSEDTAAPSSQGFNFAQEILRGLAWTLPLIGTAVILTLIAISKG